jgi:hypothetical protein
MAVYPEAERRFYSTGPRHSSMAGGVEENSLLRLRRTPNRPTLDRTTNHDDADEQHARPIIPRASKESPVGKIGNVLVPSDISHSAGLGGQFYQGRGSWCR